VSEAMEQAHETIHEAHHSASDPWARGVAVMVSVLAAALALAEMGEKSSQNAYLTHHIAVSDDWAFYQAKNLRAPAGRSRDCRPDQAVARIRGPHAR